ncbi:protein-L-isoaspartate O-methyltransferase family protein [Jannaschia sp. CCS1]|uniref:protein-L-isoaspartate O-methyltransferase family protein n=1 Tax=Jannaschia sp. (strain CCS1) TaxID=290400 RepID=UPI000053A500|nr:protein-L-isoaspartate O-methyltransferase [Jannaschia sp. CCS1]ABD56175.1 protein-L-isoaspartate(D-aspartate) O-methyltransferase [Jannaschia sp. CCS1]
MADFIQRRVTMVDTQVRPSDVTKFPVLDAMLTVPREVYAPDAARDVAYADGPIPLGDGRQVLDPRATAKLLQALEPRPSDLVLELGASTGYTTALLAHMAEAVVAIEEDEDLARDAEAALSEQGVDNAALVQGALTDGSPKHGPFDAIAIFGGVEQIPDALTEQLKEGGHIGAIFMEGALGEARIGVKAGGRITWRMAFNATAPILPGFARAPSFAF